ncbi:hypothetical protein [Acinetobacter indicus]|nr:hypothetical protein [Acinetobacter indicus]MCO8108640.1 hypothetical protein [Acinetobacter indicus]
MDGIIVIPEAQGRGQIVIPVNLVFNKGMPAILTDIQLTGIIAGFAT